MSTQTVYFTNPTVISGIQSTQSSMSGSVATLQQQNNGFPFESVPMGLSTMPQVPQNYTLTPVLSAYQRLTTTIPEYAGMGTEVPETFWNRFGEGCDGVYYIPLTGSSTEGLLISNHENNSEMAFLYTGGMVVQSLTGTTGASCWPFVKREWIDIYKQMLTMGITVSHVRKDSVTNNWNLVLDSAYNKRYTILTPFRVDGPLKGNSLMKTRFSQDGTECLGTYNNCGATVTPWGTYLSSEENCWFLFGCTNSQDPVVGRSSTELAMLCRYNFVCTGAQVTRSNWFSYFGGGGGNLADTNPVVWPGFVGYSGPLGDKNGYSSPFLAECASSGYHTSPLYGTLLMPTGTFDMLDYTCYGTTGSEDFRNQIHCMNWNKEIDPLNPNAVPRVRTALGRRFNENCAFVAEQGKPVVVYMNCDSRTEYFYKYVSEALWDEADRNGGITKGDKYLNTGAVYIARFYNATTNDTSPYGTGAWLSVKDLTYPLTYGYSTGASYMGVTINDYAEALCFQRSIGDYLGATRLDRCEWSAVDPRNNIVYTTMTSNRDVRTTPTANVFTSPWGYYRGAPALSSISPRTYRDFSSDDALTYLGTGATSNNNGNQNGHIFRLKCYSGAIANASGRSFRYDNFLFGCTPGTLCNKNINLSKLDVSNVFSMPDTCVFGEYSGQRGYLTIATDDGYMTNSSNAMTLMVQIPTGADIGDGGAVTVQSIVTDSSGFGTVSATGSVRTYVAKQRPVSRILVGVPICEITGWSETPDGKTAFTCIQHPGCSYDWPLLNTQLPQGPNGINLRDCYKGLGQNGEYTNFKTSFPDTLYNRPRSTIISIQRKDGNPIV